MSYLDHVIGQQQAKHQFDAMREAERLPHAILLTGPEGSGLLPFALGIAKSVLCVSDSCTDAACAACKKVEKIIHPDLHFTYPLAGKETSTGEFTEIWRQALLDNPYLDIQDWMRLCGLEKKQPNINVKECNEIVHRLSLKPFESVNKVYILWGAEYLGKEGNRLLKLIEEPSEGTYIILIANQLEAVLPTILSRCQLIKLSAISDDDLKSALSHRFGISAERSEQIAYIANGDFNKAQALNINEDEAVESVWSKWLTTIPKKDVAAKVEVAELLAQINRDQQQLFFEFGQHFLQEVLHRAFIDNYRYRLSSSMVKLADRLTGFLDETGIHELMSMMDTYSMYIRRNGNPRIIFLDMTIEGHKVINRIVQRRKQYA